MASKAAISADGLPTEKAREIQRKMREQRGMKNGEQKGVLEKVWLGEEGEDWKEKRLKEEQEAIDRGEGYGSLIMSQISDVFSREKKPADSSSTDPGRDISNKS
jgi:hypothetical protein